LRGRHRGPGAGRRPPPRLRLRAGRAGRLVRHRGYAGRLRRADAGARQRPRRSWAGLPVRRHGRPRRDRGLGCRYARPSRRRGGPGGGATLVVVDGPDRLDWRGRSNVYAGITAYLQPGGDGLGRPAVLDFQAWGDDPLAFREADSRELAVSAVWSQPDPLRAL